MALMESPPPRIAILPAALADQIAAGEVVERPASVVKELVENSLDAGARRIEVAIEGAGLSRIVVTDDGAGMTPEEAHLALKRHATSKLRTFDDLIQLTSMGFRGEALPSIAAVSQLSLTTRTRASDAAYRIEVEGGVVKAAREAGAPIGTEIDVRRLLANVPARLKFLKSAATETGHIVAALERLALAHPEIHFRLRIESRVHLDFPPHRSALERAKVVIAKASGAPPELHVGVGESEGIHVEAFIASPEHASPTTRATYLFVNRRFVRDRGLLAALQLGFGGIMERGRYPLSVVHIAMAAEAVDVNVHPQKVEVRFAQPQHVASALRRLIATIVDKTPWLAERAGASVQHYSFGAREPEVGYGASRAAIAESLRLFAPRSEGWSMPAPIAPAILRDLQTDAPETSGHFYSSLTYLGQLHATYLLCEAAGELVLIDQHAAHERVAYERLKKARAAQKVPSQRLLLPATIAVDAEQIELFAAHATLFAEFGFEIAATNKTLVVRAVPLLRESQSPGALVLELLAELGAETLTSHAQAIDHMLATVACHSVVRAGDSLGAEEVRALFVALDETARSAHCPHGRPALVRVSLHEIERRFGRI